ncbi:MAG: hypothetical protein M3362_26735 [Acidobacteriota bacterium]|nr:hypothetical protein [Acidobacteriota bacterium]
MFDLMSDKPIALACSLKKQIVTKLKSDVGTIVSSGSTFEAIHCFCSADVPMARRHQLKLPVITSLSLSSVAKSNITAFSARSAFIGLAGVISVHSKRQLKDHEGQSSVRG